MRISTNLAPLLLVASSLLLVGAGCFSSPSANTTGGDGGYMAPTNSAPAANTNDAAKPRTTSKAINAISKSGITGAVTLTDLPGNNTRVDVTLSGSGLTKSLPVAIYAGTCATQDAEVQYPLNPLVKGKSSTTLNVNIGAILDREPQAIKIKSDAVDSQQPFASCGELK